ncbi:LysM peptidoglycan-binding domain-containing protein [Treponema parvum]|uniref:LysM peptidoglycan-binding domain-containing protein n=1 Tax=Treponema parvum TaxID=138851 RepID=UPI001FE85A61|nr:LysM peptidoglycan-binding domain-containing protein [Treponema parvum]
MSKTIGIKLADGSFYPILEEGKPQKKRMELTTVKDNQETVQVDLYRSESQTMQDAEYVDSLQINNLAARPNGEPTLSFDITIDENNKLSALISDLESGEKNNISINLVNRPAEEREEPANFELVPESEVPDIDFDLGDSLGSESAAEKTQGGLLAAADAVKSDDDNFFDLPDFDADSDKPDFADRSNLSDQSGETNGINSTENFDKDGQSRTEDGLSFDDFYDKETLEGSGVSSEEVKKTKRHVIICLICAVICITATVLILFVVPSKLNLRTKKANKDAVKITPVAVEQPLAPPPEKPAPARSPAKENEIVVPPTPQVVPVVPAAKPESKKNISYKIKWGDTLWDISDAYYRNPWKYRKIANYNRIKNPDHIIAGTTIIIPAE